MTHQFDQLPADLPEPLSLPSLDDQVLAVLAVENMSPSRRVALEKSMQSKIPLDIRRIRDGSSSKSAGIIQPYRLSYVRIPGAEGANASPTLNLCLLAYLSDSGLLGTATASHPDLEASYTHVDRH